MFPQTEHFQAGLWGVKTQKSIAHLSLRANMHSTNERGLGKGFNLNIADGTTDPGTECFYSINNATLKNDTVLES